MKQGTVKEYDWINELQRRLEKAIKQGYFFEAITIEFMLIDDRIKGTLTHGKEKKEKISKDDHTYISKLLDDLYVSPKADILSIGFTIASNPETKVINNEDYVNMNYESILQEKKLYAVKLVRDDNNFCSEESIYKDRVKMSNIEVQPSKLLEFIKSWLNERNHWMHGAGADRLSAEQMDRQLRLLAIDGATLLHCFFEVSKRHKKAVKHSTI